MPQAAYDFLSVATNKCATDTPAAGCAKNYLVVQAHHDHCNHDDLPKFMEEGVHTYEDKLESCMIHRKYDDHLPDCVKTTATNETVSAAVSVLASNSCDQSCSSTACTDAFRALYYAHETIENDQADIALHTYEEACEEQSCNAGDEHATLDMDICDDDHVDHGDHDDHGHGKQHPCQCEAKEQGWTIDCSDQKPMQVRVSFLYSSVACFSPPS